jgi:tetratricopeptide (TPR) repeat protein
MVCIAQGVSLGYRDFLYFDALMSRFDSIDRRALQFQDYLRLRLAEAQRAFLAGDMAAAAAQFNFVLQVESDVIDPYLVIVAHYWKGRAHRRQGEYNAEQHHIQEAKLRARTIGAPKLVALTSIQEAWLLFQRGERRSAFQLLNEAENELRSTGDALLLGNIEVARGRFVRRSGEYAKALEHFLRAIEIYGDHFPGRPNVARALVNAAYVKRLLALEFQQRHKNGRARAADQVRYLELCKEALGYLDRAEKIYSYLRHQAGTGSVLVNAGYLRLDSGDFDGAEDEATKAYQLGEQQNDSPLQARARILQATILNERAEEQVGDSESRSGHAQNAKEYADEGILFATRGQNSRILAGAYLVRGYIAASDFFQDWESAKRFATLAGENLDRDDLDHLSKQLSLLKSKIIRSTGIDEKLRYWSEGLTDGKTFQQISEEFAELVIPRVWARQGKKVAGVSKTLSVSPKKVRRILRNVGLKDVED